MTTSKHKPHVIAEENQLKSYLIIAFVAFAVYANTLLNNFVYDDEFLVLGDASITNISNLPKFFTGQEGFNKVFARYYRPIVSTSFLLDYEIWGFKAFGFHLTNALIHVINTLLLFNFLLLLPRHKNKDSKFSDISSSALIGAFIFAVHPVHTEAVSFISGRTDLLAFTFLIASFSHYIKYSDSVTTNEKVLNFFLLSFYYVLSLLSKEVAITMPLLFLLFDLVVVKLRFKRILKDKIRIYIALALITLLYLLVRTNVLERLLSAEKYFYFYGKDFATALFTQSLTIPLYLRLLIFPIGLIYHYNGYLSYVSTFFDTGVIFSFGLVILIIVISVLCLKKHSLITYLCIFFFVTLSPVLNIVPITNLAAERYLYIPSISFILLIVYLGILLETTRFRNAFYVVSFAVIMIFGILTVVRNIDWKDNESLYFSADGKTGTVVNVNIGYIYSQRKQFDKAEQYFKKALQIKNETVLANTNLGKVLLLQGKYDSANTYIMTAYNFDTLNPESKFTLALMYVMTNKLHDAANQMESLQRIVPGYRNSNQILIQIRAKLQNDSVSNKTSSNKTQKTDSNMERIAKLDKDSYAQYRDKNYDNAIKDLTELVELKPSSKSIYYNNIGLCYFEQNKLDEARKYFEHSIAAAGDFSSAYLNLGKVYEKMGDKEKAKDNYKKALDCDSNNKSARENYERLRN